MSETRRRFGRNFQEGAVRLVRETGRPIARIARVLRSTRARGATGWTWSGGAGGGVLGEEERAELARLRLILGSGRPSCFTELLPLVLQLTDPQGTASTGQCSALAERVARWMRRLRDRRLPGRTSVL